MPAAAPSLDALESLVQRATGIREPLAIREMPGGASLRRFFRVSLGGARTAVAMFVPDSGVPEEASRVDERSRRWPFLEVRDLLAERGVRVPALLGESCTDGFLLVEDLGDATVAAYLETAPERREAIYQSAVRDLARAQTALDPLPETSIVRERSFGYDLLRWEIDHFREWGLEARGVILASSDKNDFDAAADFLARTIADFSPSFVHRDYQSRNLMVLGVSPREQLAWVDFQDALMGPRVYDLVALLNDSYQTFDEPFVQARLDEYAAHRGLEAERATIGREFDLVTVQRKLKDAGRFVFIDRKKGDGSYLRFVEPTIDKVRAALERLGDEPPLAALADLLDRHIPGGTGLSS